MDKQKISLDLTFTVFGEEGALRLILNQNVLDGDVEEFKRAMHCLADEAVNVIVENKEKIKKRLEDKDDKSYDLPKS